MASTPLVPLTPLALDVPLTQLPQTGQLQIDPGYNSPAPNDPNLGPGETPAQQVTLEQIGAANAADGKSSDAAASAPSSIGVLGSIGADISGIGGDIAGGVDQLVGQYALRGAEVIGGGILVIVGLLIIAKAAGAPTSAGAAVRKIT